MSPPEAESMLDMFENLARGVARNNAIWPRKKRLLKVRFLNGSPEQRDEVRRLLEEHYHSIDMSIRFHFLEEDSIKFSDIRIEFTTYSESCIGRLAERIPGDKPTMWLNTHLDPGVSATVRRQRRQCDILHEFGHALGLLHEHMHPDCTAEWNYRVLQARHGWRAASVRRNYDKMDPKTAKLGPYDTSSIMHYPVGERDTITGELRVGLNSVLSTGDRELLMELYPLETTPASTPSPKQAPKPTGKRLKDPTTKQPIQEPVQKPARKPAGKPAKETTKKPDKTVSKPAKEQTEETKQDDERSSTPVPKPVSERASTPRGKPTTKLIKQLAFGNINSLPKQDARHLTGTASN